MIKVVKSNLKHWQNLQKLYFDRGTINEVVFRPIEAVRGSTALTGLPMGMPNAPKARPTMS